MNKGYAFGFLLVLLVLALGFYVAFTSFRSSREALLAEPSATPRTQVVQATPRIARVSPSASVTALPTPAPGITATVTSAAPPGATVAPGTPSAPPTETPDAQQGQGTATLAPVPPSPTPVSISSYEFRLAGPPAPDRNWPTCCYLMGAVRDAAGNGLEGVRVQIMNQWNPPVVAATKGGSDLGKYDIPIGRDHIVWSIVLVDENGDPISTRVDVDFDPMVANAIRVDWERAR